MSSELRVNKLTSRSGVGTVTFNDSGLIITGIATAATLDITGNATIAGVLSYDDVTNVDSVGIVTAAGGVDTNTIRGKTNNSNIAIGARASNGAFVHALTITPGRDVGVGDAAPDSNYGSNLSVHSTATDGARLKLSDGSTGKTNTDGLDIISTGSVAYFINRENADMAFYTNNTERLRINSAGQLLLGTTVEGHESADDFTIETGSHAGMTFRSGVTSQGSIYFSDATSGAGEYAGWLRYDHTGNNMTIGTNSTEAIKIDNQQNFGIGVAPNAKLHVKLDTNKHLYFQGNIGEIGSVPGIQGVTDAGALASLGLRGNDLRFATGSSERLRIDSSGRLLVNTSTSRIVEDHVGNGPQGKIQIEATNSDAIMSIISAGTADSNRCGTISLGRHRNSTVGATPTIVQNGDALGAVVFAAGDGIDMRTSGAKIHAIVDGTPGSNDMPGALIFSTTPDGSSSPYNQERMRIDSSGRMGLGTNSPQKKLHVSDTSGPAQIRITGVSGSSDIYADANIYFQPNGTTRVTMDSSGRLLVGTTAGAAGRIVHASNSGNNSAYFHSTNGSSGTGSQDGIVMGMGDATNAYFWNYESGSIVFATSANERMRIDSSGRLLLGTTTEATNAEVTIRAASPQLSLYATPGNVSRVTLGDTDDWNIGQIGYDNSDNSMFFSTNNATRMSIDSSGRLLIGTTTEGHQNADNLTIADSGDCGITIRSGTSSNGRIYFSDGTSGGAEYNGSVDYDHANNSLAFFTVGAQRMRLDSDGGVFIGNSSDYSTINYSQTSGSGNFYYKKDSGSAGGTIIASNNADRGWALAYFNKFAYNSGDDNRFIAWYVNGVSQATINWNGSSVVYAGNSDYRLKTNASDYAGGIDKVKRLQVREYEWIDNPDAGRCVGFYAHELQEIFPEAVTGVKDGMKIDEFTEEEVPEYQGVDYGKITPLLTKALQEAIAKIETLEAKVAALEG